MAEEGDYSYITRKVVNYSGDGSTVYSNSERSFGPTVPEIQKANITETRNGCLRAIIGAIIVGGGATFLITNFDKIVAHLQTLP